MAGKERYFIVSPINPFTPRQTEALSLRVNGHNLNEIALSMGISLQTVKNYLYGSGDPAFEVYKTQKGVLGIAAEVLGKRPKNTNQCLEKLMDDVIFWSEPPRYFREQVQNQIADFKAWEKSQEPLSVWEE